MDYETVDGSQFSLRLVERPEAHGQGVERYTSVSAYVDRIAYTGRLDGLPEDVDEVDVLESLEPISVECIHPIAPANIELAPPFDAEKHYLKAPSFTYDDCRPDQTFVADCLLREVEALEFLKDHPHPNIVQYHGCVVKDERITHICLGRLLCSLSQYAEDGITDYEAHRVLRGIKAGLEHLHALGLAHNDINADNVCVDEDGEAVIVDFDGCLPLGEKLLKGTGDSLDTGPLVSSKDNDLLYGIPSVEAFLTEVIRRPA